MSLRDAGISFVVGYRYHVVVAVFNVRVADDDGAVRHVRIARNVENDGHFSDGPGVKRVDRSIV